MVLSHSFRATIASALLKEPVSILSVLQEAEPLLEAGPYGLIRGLDNLPPSVSVPHANRLTQALLAVLLADSADDISRRLTAARPPSYIDDARTVELRALAQHIAFSNLVPFKGSVVTVRCLKSLHAIARAERASLAIYSAGGAPVLIVETEGGLVAVGFRTTMDRIRPSADLDASDRLHPSECLDYREAA
jgi:hypothetical protein